jgi:urea carboxylase
MFTTVLIANRGAIACRIIRTLKRLGVRAVAVYSEADVGSLHVREADEAVLIGPAPAKQSYLDVEAILAAARATGAQAIHPGYGFLSENADFAARCEAEGIAFIGPAPETIRTFGLKHTARAMAAQLGIPLAPGTGLLTDAAAAVAAAADISYPVILKATAGGGGIGMKICANAAAIHEGFQTVARLGQGNFGDGGVFLERYVETARHIEVQVFGDGTGGIVALGERDCSLQRRNQKVVEETPAPLLPEKARRALIDCATRLMSHACYRSAGTVEFLYDVARQDFFFLEVNTRLQVEHGVTEQVTGVDLVEWMLRGAAGDYGFMDEPRPAPKGASIQARLYAEDPAQDYRPSTGRVIDLAWPQGARVDSWIERGSEIGMHYDPMLAKLIVTAADRPSAVKAIQQALDATRLAGLASNIDWLRTVVRAPAFVSGEVSTSALGAIDYVSSAIQVIAGGASTTVQDWPGRVGLWSVGVPPSGPMDALAFRLGNRLLGNAQDAAGLEMTAVGPTLRFGCETRMVLTGARFDATLDGETVEPYRLFTAQAGQTLRIGRVTKAGLRGYVLFGGGLDAPPYLGSRATFTLGEFGGHAARAVMAGDNLELLDPRRARAEGHIVAEPILGSHWDVRVSYGPHGAPDFFTDDDIAMIIDSVWTIHFNSNRTGVRLSGPKPRWARADGGEAGLHPSNIHDNAYAIGAVDFTGDMPIILGPDGPSLGGFVCPFVVIAADLWKIGQLAPGDTLRFVSVGEADAAAARADQETLIATLAAPAARSAPTPAQTPILAETAESQGRPRTLYRRQGDTSLLVEYGPIALDLELRLRIHALMTALAVRAHPAITDITPGIRSLQVQYDPDRLSQAALIDMLAGIEDELGTLDDFEIPSRIVHLPLSWEDPAIWQTIDKYIASVRADAPWCPDNIEFIRRINGLASRDDVKRIVFDAHYLVMGLGDVYLGAPVATPVDPRHRLVTTKYNPARTWTPPNVVGIGGAYMCIYGMEGPGGYQLFGRTIQVWNSWHQTDAFTGGKPWLLRFFDQIRFFPVSAEELVEWRRDFPLGRRSIRIEETRFRVADYRRFLAENVADIQRFEADRAAAFAAERRDWQARGEFDRVAALIADDADSGSIDIDLPEGTETVEAPMAGSLWKWLVKEGDEIAAGDTIAIIEAMKMEAPVTSPLGGRVIRILVAERQTMRPGTPLLAIVPS